MAGDALAHAFAGLDVVIVRCLVTYGLFLVILERLAEGGLDREGCCVASAVDMCP